MTLLFALASQGCEDNHEQCNNLRHVYLQMFITDNPKLDKPTKEFSFKMMDKMDELQDAGCIQPYLGQAPVKCFESSLRGLPACPKAYHCHGDFVCRHESMDASVPDRGLEGGGKR